MASRSSVLVPLVAPLLLLVLGHIHSVAAFDLRIPLMPSGGRRTPPIQGDRWQWKEPSPQPPPGGLMRSLLHQTEKRDRETLVPPELLQHYSENQVEAASRAEYKAVPFPIVSTSQMLHRGINCSALDSNLHENHIRPELQLRPDWLHISELIGDCPAHYVTRELPPLYSPAVVLEAVCTCGGSQCSRDGHQCVPVTRHIPVWVRRGPDFHVLDVEELTVACACVRRPSVGGNFIYSAAVQS